jgi:hypothetical protein
MTENPWLWCGRAIDSFHNSTSRTLVVRRVAIAFDLYKLFPTIFRRRLTCFNLEEKEEETKDDHCSAQQSDPSSFLGNRIGIIVTHNSPFNI